jgi:cellulose biosynthesis protein BcsQ
LKSLVLFNNKGGVGKTTLGYHVAHMMARRGLRVVVLDYDPQCNISAAFVPADELEALWDEDGPHDPSRTVAGCVWGVRRGKGELVTPTLYRAGDNLWLLPGHLRLSRFEQPLAEEWAKVSSVDNERALDITLALSRLAHLAADRVEADVVLVDVGPSLGALNRAALLACDAVVLPVAPDLFSLQGLRNVGPTLREWREDWQATLDVMRRRRPAEPILTHDFRPIGYIVQQHLVRADRPIKAYKKWVSRIPNDYHRYVLDEAEGFSDGYENDPARIFLFRHYASLVPLALDARKPMFDLKPVDGINGSLYKAVASCRKDVNALVTELAKRLGVAVGDEL